MLANCVFLFEPIWAHGLILKRAQLKRAPVIMRNLGLEWLWRIKEEPRLWKRYWHDALILLQLLCLRVLPLVIYRIIAQSKPRPQFSIDIMGLDEEESRVKISGAATQHNIKEIIRRCSVAVSARRQVVIDLSDTRAIDARFLGFLLMLRNSVGLHGAKVRLVGLSRSVQRQFRLNGVEFLLQPEASVTCVTQDKRGQRGWRNRCRKNNLRRHWNACTELIEGAITNAAERVFIPTNTTRSRPGLG